MGAHAPGQAHWLARLAFKLCVMTRFMGLPV